MRPRALLGLVELDVIALDVNATVQNLHGARALEKVPTFGTRDSNLGEFVRPYARFLAEWKVFEMKEAPALPVPNALVLAETRMDGNVNVSIRVSAPRSMQISVRIPLQKQGGVVTRWSMDVPLRDMGMAAGVGCVMVGEGTGGEVLDFSVIVGANKDGSRPPVVFEVSSSKRLLANESATFRALSFPDWMSPLYTESTGASFAL
eukprot:IDg7040t1